LWLINPKVVGDILKRVESWANYLERYVVDTSVIIARKSLYA